MTEIRATKQEAILILAQFHWQLVWVLYRSQNEYFSFNSHGVIAMFEKDSPSFFNLRKKKSIMTKAESRYESKGVALAERDDV